MNRSSVLKLLLSAIAVIAIGIGGYYFVKAQGGKALARSLEEHLNSGDYLAALAAAGKLQEKGDSTPELEEKISEAARMLVAEEAFRKAKTASAEKRFADAGALLRGSDAVSNPAFKQYEEAKKLYAEAEALVASTAHETAVKIHTLEERAKTEQAKNTALEKKSAALEGKVKEKEKAIAQTQSEAAETVRKLEESRKETDAKQSALIAEQARARQLMEQVEKEVKQKFFTELRTYRDMAQKGKEQLDNAVVEINGKRDVTALIYVSQGKILFEEVKNKAVELRGSRTPNAYQTRVDDLV